MCTSELNALAIFVTIGTFSLVSFVMSRGKTIFVTSPMYFSEVTVITGFSVSWTVLYALLPIIKSENPDSPLVEQMIIESSKASAWWATSSCIFPDLII